jgi:RNA polymerase sigma-70 factor (ECF subfamily)
VDEALAGRSLVDLARGGDAAAFESLVQSRMDAMYRLGLAILGDEADAADAAQMTFVAAWRQLPRLRELDRFDAWLPEPGSTCGSVRTKGTTVPSRPAWSTIEPR